MPSALETLVKILKLEQDTGYKNTAVIGGLQSYADNWARQAHTQAKRSDHHQLIDELVRHLDDYAALEDASTRHDAIKYMMGRIMGRIPAPPDLPPVDSSYETPEPDHGPPEAAPVSPDEAAISPEEVADESPGDAVEEEPEQESEEVPEEEPEETGPAASFAPPALASDLWDDSADSPPVLPSTPSPRRARRAPLTAEEIETQREELSAPITALPKVGAKMAEKLAALGIHTIADMLFTFPRRYDDYTRMKTLNRLQPGEVVTVVAAVQSATKKQGQGGRPYLLVMLDDGTNLLQVTFFGQMWLQRQFKRGSQVVLSGQVELFRGQLTMTNPEWEMIERENLHTRRIVPVYALTKGLAARTMRRLMYQAIEHCKNRVPDYLPESVLERANLVDLGWALAQIHFPESYDYLAHARTRLSFDELFLFQMAMLRHRRDWQSTPAQPIHVPDEWLSWFVESLPYPLTQAQRRALDDIHADLTKDIPMNRLLQGDVGSGKTVVAATAMAMVVQNGRQAALMAPTGILAEQHARSLDQLFSYLPEGARLQVRLLTGSTSESERHDIYAGLSDGRIPIIVGTHALIQEGVEFANLGLVIVDEQHRFGVEQRGMLRGKGVNPHTLVMTATPIPRTLALTLYADLDLSIIDEMPPGRSPVETRVLRRVERERAYSFIQTQLNHGRQAFIVYPLVESSEKMDDLGAAVNEYERLSQQVFYKYRVGLLHGRMKPAEKDAVMVAFAQGDIDVLVSTSVVEVGIDVPNASVILIEDADRFGLAQLHQFRGRVGRGPHHSYCLLVAESTTPGAEQRLKAMEDTTDGFKLAEIDWELRGPGDLLGTRQSGIGRFRLAELMNPRLVELAQREARTVYAEDPYLEQSEHHALAQRTQPALDQRADVS